MSPIVYAQNHEVQKGLSNLNDAQRQRLKELKIQDKSKMRKRNINNHVLLQECLEALGEHAYMLSEIEEKEILNTFESQIPLVSYGTGRVDWNKIANAKEIEDLDDLQRMTSKDWYYIIWNESTLPIVKCDFQTMIHNIDDVLAVSFDTWLFSEDFKEVIEFCHEGAITSGIIH